MILVGIGGNLPDASGTPPLVIGRRAVEALGALPGLRLAAVSGWYASDPVPPQPGSPPYVNAVARLEGRAGAEPLLASLQAIEAAAGRTRPYRNAPRTLDLDLIDLDGLVRDAPDPILPHPRAALRAFVLLPLAEVAPGWRHPRTGESVSALIAALPPQVIRRLA
ncbi:2-amino-4-hydroxy-6-hydroxymethyldihydropteridine diphosphokinase [Roseomonas sp. NAR14]|uniref:2-amino-4-hydroxy-6-hydroxymethyldihydropteridine pyrophosphokinase n=1 Tax=Roseomonas acroporae TaxID=2937791 RepID=A0A9X2BSV7_9PROT|nr:2-amino-4-hydroxy-6-hydroxymethyldihydropteridine diphosphokinase [Roseomonas acroporae]MCK8783567.1 2-amino-4-hydroxy-6-hydroxymethyldihydropteridine diphosphokinase [Roseomonas acroporae]